MAYRVVYTDPALEDLRAVREYSEHQFPLLDPPFADELVLHIDLLADFPLMEEAVRRRRTVRKLVHSPLIVYYLVDTARREVRILHLWRGSRRAPRL